MYGLQKELNGIYGFGGLWTEFNNTFDWLPLAATVDATWFCVHGGISQQFVHIEKLYTLRRTAWHADDSLVAEILWSDPVEHAREWQRNARGAGVTFGAPQVAEFLRVNRLQRIARAHQLARDGYKWFFDNTLVIVWSAPNYAYREDNDASIMSVNGDQQVFSVFSAHPESSRQPPDDLGLTYFA
jgi:diadenosine tetraphosphatase ApaH/serine/threonine PP2A family protein phosphatase